MTQAILERLRGRRGLDILNSSQDDLIKTMSPEDMVRECAAWEIGDPGWADLIAYWMTELGAKPENF